MNTRLGKSFGLAFVVAVGILAVMFALGTFNAPKAGADATGTPTIEPASPDAGANVEVEVTFVNDSSPISNYGTFSIELEGWGLPSSIDTKDVLVHVGDSAANPENVEVTSGEIIIELNQTVDGAGIEIGAQETATVVIRKRAGLTAPANAGMYDVTVDEATATDAVMISAKLTVDPEKGGSGTMITVSGKAFANGTGTLSTYADNDTSTESVLKDVTVANGAFSTTVAAKDLVKADSGISRIKIVDADGGDAIEQFTVTGTTTLGSDSVGKGELLKISIADWIDFKPEFVRIGGIRLETVDKDNIGYTVALDADNAATFYVKVGGEIGLGTKTVVLFSGTNRLDDASVEITSLDLSVSPSSAVPGQEITVEGTGFTSGSKLVELTVGGVAQTALSNRNMVNDYDVLSGGRIVISFKVPDGVTDGSKNIQVTDDDSRIGEVSLTVPEPTITLNPDTSRRGTDVSVSGTGFPANSNITVDYGSGETGIATGRSDATGNFTTSFGIPSDATIGGDATVKASVNDYEAEATHAVPDKAITVTPEVARSGDTVMIVGTGFPRYADVQVKIGDGVFRATNSRTDGIGDFTVSVIVPGIDSGTHVLQVDAGGSIATWVMTVPDAAVITTRPSGDVFEPLTTAGVLTVVWHFDNDTKAWSFYDPRPEVAAAVDLTMVSSGDNVWIQVTADMEFQGEPLTTGWNNITLD